jgi:Flp pilus assembly pilin Flp
MTARARIEAFLFDARGGAAAEYALILGIVGLGIVAALAGLKKPPSPAGAPAAGAAANRR